MPSVSPLRREVDPSRCETLVDLLRLRGEADGDGLAYTFLEDGEREAGRRTFGELDGRAKAVAAVLQRRGDVGDRALLVYPPGLEYVEAFFGCLYAGLVPVPVYPPRPNRSVRRLRSILSDSGAALLLSTTDVLDDRRFEALGSLPRAVEWIRTDTVDDPAGDSWQAPGVDGEDLALLQYTSGATAAPKGVMVSHANLLANERMIQRALGHDESSTFASWLPIYHDMGLIGNLLQPLYVGASCVFMSPTAFLQKPARWLRAIGDYRARTSGAPNFAYDLCVERIGPEEREALDLSSWRVAYNGSEPVRAGTLERFATAFAPAGFRREAFWPCYGLAEATLLVSGGAPNRAPRVRRFGEGALDPAGPDSGDASAGPARRLVSCGGAVDGVEIAVVDPETRTGSGEGRVGEIWVRGASVAQGYWNRPVASEASFSVRRRDTGEGPYLRTGDLGLLLDGELFLTGRLKDLVIIRGKNHYPRDIEDTVEGCHEALRSGGAVACGVEDGGAERLVIFAEVERRHYRNLDPGAVLGAIRSAVAEEHELAVHAVFLLKPGRLPRTSCGKKQRHACRRWFRAGGGDPITEWRASLGPQGEGARRVTLPLPASLTEVEDWLAAAVEAEISLPGGDLDRTVPLASQGVDSIAATLLCHRIEAELGVIVSAGDVVGEATVADLADRVWAARSRDPRTRVSTPEPADGAEAPLSHGQRALWFLDQVEPESDTYVIARAVRVHGRIDVDALQRAVDGLVARHDALRTAFVTVGGRPRQRVVPDRSVRVVEVDTRGWSEARLREEVEGAARRPFDLRRDALLRLILFRGGPEPPLFLICVHHIVADLWSLALMMQELGVLYGRALGGEGGPGPLAPARVSPSDLVRWQSELLAGPRGRRMKAFWEDELAGGIPSLDLPVDRAPKPGSGPGTAGRVRFGLGPAISSRVRSLAREQGATLYMTHLAALQALLYRYTGQERFVVGSLTSGRSRADLAAVVGYLVNPVAFRADVSPSEPFEALLRQTRERVKDVLRHQDYPFSLVVESLRPERSAARPQLIQVMFVFQRAHLLDERGLDRFALGEPGARMEWGGLSLESLELPPLSAPFDLTVTVADLGEEIRGSLDYRADLFEEETVRGMARHLVAVLAGAAGDPSLAVDELPLERKPGNEPAISSWGP